MQNILLYKSFNNLIVIIFFFLQLIFVKSFKIQNDYTSIKPFLRSEKRLLSYVQDRRWRSRVLKLEISSSDEASSNVPKVNPVLPALVARGAVSHIVPFTDPTDPRTSGVPAVKNPRLRLLEAAQRADWSEFAGFLHEASNPVGDCMFVLETIVSREEWWKAVQVFLRLRRLGIQPNLKAHNLMLKTYAALGLPQQAYNQYQAMKASAGVRPNNESFEHLLCVMTFCEDLDGGKMVLEILQDYNGLGIPFRPEVYKRALRVCGHLRDLESGEKALELLAARGLSPNLAIYNQMIYMYGACAEWERAVQTAEEMKSQGFYPNAMTYFALIVACGDSLGLEQALRLFDSMKLSGPVPKECYSGAIRVCCNANDHAKARALLDEMKNENDARGGRCAPSRIDYDYVLRCCASNAEAWREALDLLRTMRNDGITPESRTYVVLMDTLRKVKRPAKALEVFYRMRKQGTINIHPKCFSAAICAASEQDKPKLALSLLEEAKINGAATSSVYAAAINACANAKDYLTACDLLDEMQQKEVPMTVEAVGAAIKACYEAGLWRQAVKLLELLTTKKVPGDTLQCFNTAISACAKASRWKEALSLLEIIKKHNQSGPDIFSYSSVITACARADKFEKVQELVQEMEQKQLPGNLITYNALASAHRKKGDYRSIFRIMKEMRHFGIQPDDVGGVAMDVFEQEPPTGAGLQLVAHEKVVCTPHLGASTDEAQINVAKDVALQMCATLEGREYVGVLNVDYMDMANNKLAGPFIALGEMLGKLVKQKYAGNQIVNVEVESWGEHGIVLHTTQARKLLRAVILKGILSKSEIDVEPSIINAPFLAEQIGLASSISEERPMADSPYTNLVSAKVLLDTGDCHVITGSVFGNDPHIVQIDDFKSFPAFRPTGSLLTFKNDDRPGAVSEVLELLTLDNVNVASMALGRQDGHLAICLMDLDSAPSEKCAEALQKLSQLQDVRIASISK
mmetsp:Transcript_14613/g.19225  ORF Transcript_14613/g.19225 Transcript_14613/m.19225 type:complete len:972 (-) Transcript_14613:126-3041(-)